MEGAHIDLATKGEKIAGSKLQDLKEELVAKITLKNKNDRDLLGFFILIVIAVALAAYINM